MQKRTREKPPLWNRPVLLRGAFPWGKVAARKGSRMRGGRHYRF